MNAHEFRSLREALGLSIRRSAELLDVWPGTIQRWSEKRFRGTIPSDAADKLRLVMTIADLRRVAELLRSDRTYATVQAAVLEALGAEQFGIQRAGRVMAQITTGYIEILPFQGRESQIAISSYISGVALGLERRLEESEREPDDQSAQQETETVG